MMKRTAGEKKQVGGRQRCVARVASLEHVHVKIVV